MLTILARLVGPSDHHDPPLSLVFLEFDAWERCDLVLAFSELEEVCARGEVQIVL